VWAPSGFLLLDDMLRGEKVVSPYQDEDGTQAAIFVSHNKLHPMPRQNLVAAIPEAVLVMNLTMTGALLALLMSLK